jgi:hypothetical protein
MVGFGSCVSASDFFARRRTGTGPDSLCILSLTFHFVMMHPVKTPPNQTGRRCKARTRGISFIAAAL